jgi:hypothetical protein
MVFPFKLESALSTVHLETIISVAARNKLPTIYPYRDCDKARIVGKIECGRKPVAEKRAVARGGCSIESFAAEST